MIVLVDSSAVLALLNNQDRWHEEATAVLKSLVVKGVTFAMTNFLVAECHALLLVRLDRNIAREWLLTFDWNLIRVTPGDESFAREIIKRYHDKGFSLTDAISFAVIRRYGINLAFTFDQHFRQYGIATVGR